LTRKELLRFIFWEWIEPLGSALCIALLVMKFIVALYVIPTGSMQPTLHGKGDYPHELGDKVLVNKFVYRFQKPERWDVIVFDYPFNTIMCNNCGQDVNRLFPKHLPKVVPDELRCQNLQCMGRKKNLSFIDKEYIKRCTAVPGDEISIRDGNVVLRNEKGDWTPSIKTDEAQAALWVDVFNSSELEDMPVKGASWRHLQDPNPIDWQENSPLVLGNKGPSTLIFEDNEDALKGYGDKGIKGKGPMFDLVGDILLDLELKSFPSQGTLVLEVDRNRLSHRFQIDFKSQSWVLMLGKEELGKGQLPQNSRISFARLDGRLEVILDGERQGFDFDLGEIDSTETVVPKIRWSGEAPLSISKIRVARDIYYVFGTDNNSMTGAEKSYVVRPGEYFAMGDNSYFSSDSRTWGPVPEEELIGKALVVILPFHRIKFIR